MYEAFNRIIRQFVPYSYKNQIKCSLPWLSERCLTAIASKHRAEGSSSYQEAASTCKKILCEEHEKYQVKIRERMRALPRNSKHWWSLAKQLMRRNSSASFFPPLKSDEGEWLLEPKQKADAFAKAFSGKFDMPPRAPRDFLRCFCPSHADSVHHTYKTSQA